MSEPNRKILVVDDDQAMVRSLCDVLTLSGWDASNASSGEEAIERVDQESFDVVLMDVKMGGVTGVEALRSIRNRHPTLPVVLMTAYSSSRLLQDANDWGATRVLFKPLPIPTLLELLTLYAEDRRALLLVDDDPEFVRSMSTVLEARGYRVYKATTIEQALTHLRHRHPMVVLLDLNINHLQPNEVIRVIRNASTSAAIILLSGFPGLLAEATAPGTARRVYATLQKPFQPDELTQLLDDVLD
jgi:CheY-like chemotaxis protein